jgi:hypothetical protein
VADETPVAPEAVGLPAAEEAQYIVFDERKFKDPADFVKSLFSEILDRTGLESLRDVVIPKRVVWEDPDGKTTSCDLNSNSPFDPASLVIGIFHDEEEARVYTLPKESGEAKRYCLSKRGRTFVLESLSSLEMVIDLMAAEYRAMHDDEDEDDEEVAPGEDKPTAAP